MKIAFVNQPWNVCPPPGMGSIAICTYQIARRLAAKHEVVVYSRNAPEMPNSEVRDGIAFKRFPIWWDGKLNGLSTRLGAGNAERPLYIRQIYFCWYAFRVAMDLRRRRCDVVHIQNIIPFSAMIRRFNPGVRIVLQMHCEWLTQFAPEVLAPFARRCDALVGCSNHISEPMKDRFPGYAGRIATVFEGVDTECPAAVRSGSKEVIVLFVGRLSPDKGVHDLIEAFGRVGAERDSVRLRIIGPEMVTPQEYIVDVTPELSHLARFYGKSYLQTLQEMVPEGLRERVEFVGHVPHVELKQHFAAADILVQPSLTEPFGMPVIEGMACGLPVVGTRVGGIKESVEDGRTGYLVEAGNVTELGDRILQLVDDAAERKAMGTRGRERACEMFSWDAAARSLEKLYLSLR